MMIDAPNILLNGVARSLEGVAASTTLLDWLRGPAGLRGTKEGCAEGDCGACTVVLERLVDGEVRREAVNACMLMVGQVDGLGVRTVEGLAPGGSAGDGLHPVQRAYVEAGGTQCGFCTPGFVMATYALLQQEVADVAAIHDGLAGNLCRCTGYRSILDAVQRATSVPMPVIAADGLAEIGRRTDAAFEAGGCRFYAPRSLAAALDLRAAHPGARLLAGGTDLGLLASRERTPPETVIHLGWVPALTAVREADGALVVGAAVTYSAVLERLAARHPGLRVYLTRLGSVQIRNLGTIGGNVATASPIGDSLPMLLALDAGIEMSSAARGTRVLPAAEFFTGYRRIALAPDELVTAIRLPEVPVGTQVFAEKVSKRRDQDISTVAGVFRVTLEGGVVRDVRLAFGGVAATPVRALAAEDCLRGTRFEDEAVTAAIAALPEVVRPIGDWRASAAYRATVAGNLLRRLQLRLQPQGWPMEVDAL